ncbi:UDP-N-acetylglucosamine 1-carboxyvinyltransferase [Acetanaerobacterium elongatum]|uniref:UDP-N-acetylglucosamine 1-carboxyvinyltransferase n=1 Tax=Acetanaerobacterium elongatum TaxID=258515 RepID=A0A1G9VHR7_9FIRM|nr:UDP-N-acetylglucosamine 1-carboxyvinyltransferase [Acetanaerobacterium elongatum]SDM71744.1 UDP-N-acetylglucosamine 1-carboxyvinyltransferase [Acetanaerobacterium elongatum]
MNKYLIDGGRRISGEIRVQGAKNSALPILAASIMCTGSSVIENCPCLSDIDAARNIIDYLGCTTEVAGDVITIHTGGLSRSDIPTHLMREMRSSIVFLGAILARTGRARISYPGGCELGPRPIDLHIYGLRQLGAEIAEDHGYIDCTIPNGLKGAHINLSFPSVGATENVMIAATLAKGETSIANAAREPEIVDLANYLNACGAKIKGAGESTIFIEGVKELTGTHHAVIPDRIAAATFLSAAAVTGGEIWLNEIHPRHIGAVVPVLEQAGCKITLSHNSIHLLSCGRPKAMQTIRTMPYPGFPTDAQAPIMSVAAIADGTTIFVENIFENRFKHVTELIRLGAKVKLEGRVAVVEGTPRLYSASVECTDLRGGAALVVAALVAEGTTEISGVRHIDRGYEKMEDTLASLGAQIRRVE